MTSLQSFPEEVLHTIFSKLSRFDVQQCQKVCQSWYFPAHIWFLQDIKVEFAIDFKRFANSINHNPNTYYLHAVQKITLGNKYNFGRDTERINEISKEVLEMILLFPNLKSVIIYGDSSDPPIRLNDINLHAIATSCRKLERFDICARLDNGKAYLDLLYKLRHTLTCIRITELLPKIVEEYVANFPHLRTIRGINNYLNSFDKLLHLIEKVPALKDICFGHDGDHGATIAYLSSKSKNEKDLLVKRLSSFTTLSTYQNDAFCVNIASFIVQYFTGLKSLDLASYHNTGWNDQANRIFCKLLEYARNLEKFELEVNDLRMEGLSKCIAPVIQMMLSHQTMKRVHTYLALDFSDSPYSDSDAGVADLQIQLSQGYRTIKLYVKIIIYDLAIPQNIILLFEPVSRLDHIDIFRFGGDQLNRGYNQDLRSIYNETFKSLTRRMPSLTELVLDFPSILGKDLHLDNTLVTNLTLRVKSDGNLLKSHIVLFPGLENLQLFYFSGVWQEDMYEYQLSLGFCNLRKLTLDLTPAKREMGNCKKDAFILIEFKLFSNSQ